MINYDWEILKLNYVISGSNNVVISVDWKLCATLDTNLPFIMFGTTQLPSPDMDHFVPYADITEIMVTDWFEPIAKSPNSYLVSTVEKFFNDQMTTLPLPWLK